MNQKLKKNYPSLAIDTLDSQSFNPNRITRYDSAKYDRIISVTKFTKHITEYTFNGNKGFIRLRPSQGFSTVVSILDKLHPLRDDMFCG